MTDYQLDLPADFEEYAWELEYKGWFEGAVLAYRGKRFRLHFFDPVRLGQEIQSSIEHQGGVFFEPNVVVIPQLTRSNMERAAAKLVEEADLAVQHGNQIDLLEETVTPKQWRTS